MKLLDAIKQPGAPFIIPDCSRYDLPEFFKEMGYAVGAEIGVYKAGFTEMFASAGLRIYGIDPYLSYDDHIEGRQHREDFLHRHAQRVLAPYSNATLIRKTSMEAVKDFEKESLDFVYIDGNHGLKYVVEDLWEWSKKVRPGGIIAGHDYGHKPHPRIDPFCVHVTHGVDAFVQCFGIKNWYVFGRVGKDRWGSFMWIRP